MERGTTFFLRATVVVIGLAILAICAWGLPLVIGDLADTFPAYMLLPVLIIAYASAIPFFYALYQALRLLRFIDRNHAFSERSVQALKRIKYCGFAICALYAASLPFLYLMAEKDDAPGLVVIGLVIAFASLVIAVFAAVLQQLLKSAVDFKSELDFTV
ncbi:Protein of unknown function [Paenibacillus sp. UNC496MF]|uniref:DUF2975 domain-containing protein n=1 Tax=Paenibacillus sp. UNC496MF TaxID=1502753 RepID=UPI0008E4434E|nr:DUF2975 domain-containing protein [Paenibacillus sp. UNC496MF]SFJ16044.1 Protein of unknown function [Paenibacillus sp. UNC496MF]